MKLHRLIKTNEFIIYFFIGTLATLLDWSVFWITTHQWFLHYEWGLLIGYLTASLFHYFSNKFFTFACHSDKIISQYFIYFMLATLSLIISMGLMAIWVKIVLIPPMTSRILTTVLMLLPNYLLHKHITFSRKIFAPIKGN